MRERGRVEERERNTHVREKNLSVVFCTRLNLGQGWNLKPRYVIPSIFSVKVRKVIIDFGEGL